MGTIISLFSGVGGLGISFHVHRALKKTVSTDSIELQMIEDNVVIDDNGKFDEIYELRNNELAGYGLSIAELSVIELARRTKAKIISESKLLLSTARRLKIEACSSLSLITELKGNKSSPNEMKIVSKTTFSQVSNGSIEHMRTIANVLATCKFNHKNSTPMT